MPVLRWLLLAWLGTAVLGTASASAQGGDLKLTLDPAMVKGPMTAPVTIVEFSDYQ